MASKFLLRSLFGGEEGQKTTRTWTKKTEEGFVHQRESWWRSQFFPFVAAWSYHSLWRAGQDTNNFSKLSKRLLRRNAIQFTSLALLQKNLFVISLGTRILKGMCERMVQTEKFPYQKSCVILKEWEIHLRDWLNLHISLFFILFASFLKASVVCGEVQAKIMCCPQIVP